MGNGNESNRSKWGRTVVTTLAIGGLAIAIGAKKCSCGEDCSQWKNRKPTLEECLRAYPKPDAGVKRPDMRVVLPDTRPTPDTQAAPDTAPRRRPGTTKRPPSGSGEAPVVRPTGALKTIRAMQFSTYGFKKPIINNGISSAIDASMSELKKLGVTQIQVEILISANGAVSIGKVGGLPEGLSAQVKAMLVNNGLITSLPKQVSMPPVEGDAPTAFRYLHFLNL